MLKLVKRRELREVDFDFANEVLAMADRIIALDRESRDARLDPGHGAYEFFEAFERVPVPVFKGIEKSCFRVEGSG